LCFPGFLRCLLDLRVRKITDGMKIAAAYGIAKSIPDSEITAEKIVPDAFEPTLAKNIKEEMKKVIDKSG
jgi:malate dehydrogenase (oxaloacetate-decarboxylating)